MGIACVLVLDCFFAQGDVPGYLQKGNGVDFTAASFRG